MARIIPVRPPIIAPSPIVAGVGYKNRRTASGALIAPHVLVAGGGGVGGGGSFTPLQHLSMDAHTTGQPVTALDQFYSSLGNGYGSSVTTSVHRPGKAKSLRMSIQAGTTGSPGDGAPVGHGLWGGIIYPPASRGTNYFGGEGNWLHVGMWIYVPSSFNPTTNIQDGALKFSLNACPITGGTTGKDDVHICVDGFAFLSEWDANSSTNNSYPSQRAGTEQGFPTDQWVWWERGDFLHSNGDLAITRIWVGNVLWLERVGRLLRWRTTDGQYHSTTRGTVGCPTLPISTARIESVYLLTYWNGFPSTDQELFVDDITTAVSQAGMTSDAFGNFMIGSDSRTDTSQIALYNNFSAITLGQAGISVTTSEGNLFAASATSVIANDRSEAPFTRSLKESTIAGVDDPSAGHVWTFEHPLHKGDEVWHSVRVFFPTGFSFSTSTHLKWMRFHLQTSGGGHLGYNDIYLSGPAEDPGGGNPPTSATGWQFINEAGAGSWNYFDHSGDHPPVLGTWETYDFYVYLDDVPVSEGGNGRVRFWKNKQLLGEVLNRQTLGGATQQCNNALWMTYWNGSAPATQSLWVQQAAVAVQRASPSRDDTPHLAVDNSGRRIIAVGL